MDKLMARLSHVLIQPVYRTFDVGDLIIFVLIALVALSYVVVALRGAA